MASRSAGTKSNRATPPLKPARARGGKRRDGGLLARIERDLLGDAAPMYAADAAGNLLFANDGYRELVEAAAAAARAEPGAPGTCLASPGALADVARDLGPLSVEESFLVGGEERRFRSRHAPVLDAKGALVAVRGVYHDVTPERVLRRRAAESRDRLDDITRLASDWIWEVDRDFRFTAVSVRAMEVFGVHPRMLLGASLFDVGEFTEAGAKAPNRDWRTPFRDKSFRVVNRTDGNTHLCRLGGMPVFDATTGAFMGYRGTGNDITAKIEAEKRASRAQRQLAEAIESSSEAFALFDPSDRLVICNGKFREYHPMIAELIEPGVGFDELVRSGAERGQFADAIGRVDEWVAGELERQRDPQGAHEQRMSDGRWLQVSDRRTDDGSTVRLRTDITGIKRREDALRRAEAASRAAHQAADLANRAKSEFLANMSHELRTPLNAIIGFSEILAAETFGPIESLQYRGYIKDILDSGTHLARLIGDILDGAKVEAGRLELDEGIVDVAAGIESCVRLMAEPAENGKVDIAVELPPRLPALYADERKIHRILLNLMSNAVKFTPPGGTVTVTAGIDGDGRLFLAVADTGIGIANEDLGKVMAPFGQVASALTRGHQGAGLGLPLTKAMVELHGGFLDLESQPNVGTTVTVHLPAERLRPAIDPAAPSERDVA